MSSKTPAGSDAILGDFLDKYRAPDWPAQDPVRTSSCEGPSLKVQPPNATDHARAAGSWARAIAPA